jgi:hypothetical protein
VLRKTRNGETFYINLREHLLTPSEDNRNYFHVRLTDKTGKITLYKVHRLVIENFVDENLSKDKDLEIHHLDLDKSNNRLENLLVVTKEEHLKIHKQVGKKHIKKIQRKAKRKFICEETR